MNGVADGVVDDADGNPRGACRLPGVDPFADDLQGKEVGGTRRFKPDASIVGKTPDDEEPCFQCAGMRAPAADSRRHLFRGG